MTVIPPPPMSALDNFKPYVPRSTYRFATVVQGKEKEGKTNFALTAPGPIVFFSTDPAGFYRCQPDVRFPGKDIRPYFIPDYMRNGHPDVVKESAGRVWRELRNLHTLALQGARTVVYDSFTDIWVLARMAEFGKNQVKGIHYGPVNAEFHEFIREYDKYGANLILLHKETEDYNEEGNKIRGSAQRKGFSDIGFDVDEIVRCTLEEPSNFKIQVIRSGLNAQINGKVFNADPSTAFVDYAMQVYPQSMPTDWM